MGHGILVSCKNCHFSREFELGVGMQYFSLENVQNQIHYTRRPKVKEILDNHDIKETDYAHTLYYCRSCHSLFERFYIKILYDNDQIYETGYACSKCGKLLTPIKEEDLPKVPCSSCGEFGLKIGVAFYWD